MTRRNWKLAAILVSAALGCRTARSSVGPFVSDVRIIHTPKGALLNVYSCEINFSFEEHFDPSLRHLRMTSSESRLSRGECTHEMSPLAEVTEE